MKIRIGKTSKDSHLRDKDTTPITDAQLDNIRNNNDKNWNEWVKYKFRNDGLSDVEKAGYTYYCAGFLAYYDQVLRNTFSEHTILLDWGPENFQGDKITVLRVFISPPCDNNFSKKLYPKISNLNPNEDFKNSTNTGILASYGFTTDPPPPPPPPPPVMA